MGIRIADNPALLQIRIVPLQLMQFLQIPDLRCLKTAVRRYESQICNQAVGRLIHMGREHDAVIGSDQVPKTVKGYFRCVNQQVGL